MLEEQQIFYHLGAALAVGLLIGIERGWKERRLGEGERVAGVRTYALLGLMGGAIALLAERLGAIVFGLAFLAVAGLLTAAHILDQRRDGDVGITSQVAGLLTLVLGALAGSGEVTTAGAAAVVTTLVLGFKPELHRWVSALEEKELRAAIKLLLISFVVLPVLPNTGYGPWQALNPYQLWWMVVLIAAISFAGYFALKIAGTRKGAVFTGLFAGLASSTGLTLHFSRLARQQPEMAPALATGTLLACGTMFPRLLLVSALINRDLAIPVLIPAASMALVVYGTAFAQWRATPETGSGAAAPVQNPLELRPAPTFGALLAAVMILAEGLEMWLGDAGVYLLALASGVADVDAITLSVARMSQADLAMPVAVTAIVIAAAVNTLVKGGMATVVGGKGFGLRVGVPLLAAALTGLAAVWLEGW